VNSQNDRSWSLHRAHKLASPIATGVLQTILSFDVEEHYRIEAASKLSIPANMRAHYSERLEPSTRWLLDLLDEFGIKATFFIVGQIARSHPQLVRRIAERGHEIGSHSWDHRRVHMHSPESFREDLRLSRDALEQVSGLNVLGYRAPTFSIVNKNAWALDVLCEEGFAYDSSIFPVRHDRYGVPGAPRGPFLAQGVDEQILEFPPATLRLWGCNLPAGGGGYFRLFPPFILRNALRQIHADCLPNVAMLYFHPWEFDPYQQRLSLGRMSSWRTYVGIDRSRERLRRLLMEGRYVRAIDVARDIEPNARSLPRYSLNADEVSQKAAPVGNLTGS